jgi:hypothetical protein
MAGRTLVIAFVAWMLSVGGVVAPAAEKPAAGSAAVTAKQPTLPADTNDLYVVVDVRRFPGPDANDANAASRLESAIQARLEKAGMHVVPQSLGSLDKQFASVMLKILAQSPKGGRADPNTMRWRRSDLPILRATVSVLSQASDSPSVLHVQMSLIRSVRLIENRDEQLFAATVWSAEPAMERVSGVHWTDDAGRIVLQQAEDFVAAPRASSAANAVPASVFVAFRTNSVFHRPDCPVARTIRPEDLVTYKTRDEALAAGREPCRSCNP